MTEPPHYAVPFVAGEGGFDVGPFRRADGTAAKDRTDARLTHDGTALTVRFRCADRHIWSTFTRRDDPLWQEEAVELFLAPGVADPVDYFEFEVNPAGILFDARVRNPHSRREEMTVDPGWDCPGITWSAQVDAAAGVWWAELRVPLGPLAGGTIPATWRANLFRIERHSHEPPEFSCWSPTFTEPADFHKPNRFGFLELAPIS